jgi:hypothetical protein
MVYLPPHKSLRRMAQRKRSIRHTRNREMLGLNLDHDTCYPDTDSSWFLSVFPFRY